MLKKVLSTILAVGIMFCFSSCSQKTSSDVHSNSSKTTNNSVSDIQEDTMITDNNSISDTESSNSNQSETTDGSSLKPGKINTTKNRHSNRTTAKPATDVTQKIPDEVIYIYGGDSNEHRAKFKKMGEQSWYPMYSTLVNVNIKSKNYDLSKLKPCKQTLAGLFKPNETVTDKDGNKLTGSWFAIRKDGFCSGDTAFTAALKWVCEYDGTYKVNISYSGGSAPGYPEKSYMEGSGENAYEVSAADGIYMSAYINNKKVMGADTWAGKGHRVEQTDLTFKNQKLKKGQTVVIVADPKSNGGWDDPWWYVSIERVGN